ncbi:hypothetical protein RJ639_000732, partial [Escallonia herrerae]
MGFWRRIAGYLGFPKDEAHEARDGDNNEQEVEEGQEPTGFDTAHLNRKGFSVTVQVPVDKASPGPVLLPCNPGEGGLQGFRWYARRLKIDEDGDVADEFFDEVLQETKTSSGTEDHHSPIPRFEVNNSVTPAKVRRQALSTDGKIKQLVEYQGRPKWVLGLCSNLLRPLWSFTFAGSIFVP